jgi:hypothetical protein
MVKRPTHGPPNPANIAKDRRELVVFVAVCKQQFAVREDGGELKRNRGQ